MKNKVVFSIFFMLGLFCVMGCAQDEFIESPKSHFCESDVVNNTTIPIFLDRIMINEVTYGEIILLPEDRKKIKIYQKSDFCYAEATFADDILLPSISNDEMVHFDEAGFPSLEEFLSKDKYSRYRTETHYYKRKDSRRVVPEELIKGGKIYFSYKNGKITVSDKPE